MSETNIALLYDPVMLDHKPGSGHPERPQRASIIIENLQKSDIWNKLTHPEVRPAVREDLLRVHTGAMISHVEKICSEGGGVLDEGDTVASAGTWHAACMAAGAAISAVDTVMTSTSRSDGAFAVIRPPGHHATRNASMGFCIFNNIAVAAAYAIEKYDLERILIVDFDVHHGNGTQDIFYNDPRVLTFSIHQHPAYPGTGRLNETGEGKGAGYTVNVPIPPGIGDEGYTSIFETVLMPVAARYNPQLILVSAGYDAHWRNGVYVSGIDERMTVKGYHTLAGLLKQLSDAYCPGRLAAIMEGGYDLDALTYGIRATLSAWLGNEQIEDPIGESPRGIISQVFLETRLLPVRRLHKL